MSIARHYVMIAKEGGADALAAALSALAGKVRPIAGCEGVDLLQDARTAEHFIFIERWASIDAHKAGGAALGKEALAEVLAALAEPPQARNLENLPLAQSGS